MFNEGEVKNINMLYEAGLTYKEIAQKYNCTPPTIMKVIVNRRNRKGLSPLQRLLKEHNVKQRDMAKVLNLTEHNLSRKMANNRSWNVVEAYTFCNHLGIKLDDYIVLFLRRGE